MIPDWERVRQRYEAWWAGEKLDYPLVRITAPLSAPQVFTPPREQTALVEWLTEPVLVIPRLEARIAATYYAGDAFPWADPLSQSMAAIQTAFHGAPYTIDPDTLTGWAGTTIEDWNTRRLIEPIPSNFWWQATLRLLEAGARAGGECWCAAIPDLQGGGEVLALLRGSEQLALDLHDCPVEIAPALSEINQAWFYYFTHCYQTIHLSQNGYVDWLGIWSDLPMATVECDFMVMVSARMFERFFQPAIEEQVKMVDRTLFHLDGPGAVKHLEMLLTISGLQGIQWVPTPERPRPVDWIPLFKRIQAAGKRVVINCPADDLPVLLDELNPGLLMTDTACASVAEADTLSSAVKLRFKPGKTAWPT